MLKTWMGDSPSDCPLWPGTWASSRAAAEMIRRDLATTKAAWGTQAPSEPEKAQRAKSSLLEYRDASDRIADFHSLRHTFITNLARGKVHPKNAQALARHSTINLTMNAYTHTVLGDLATDVGKLPALPVATTTNDGEAVTLADTGTDGPLRPDDDPKRRTKRRMISDSACENMSSSGNSWRNEGAGGKTSGNAETRQFPAKLAGSDHSCRNMSTAEGGSRTHTPTEGLRILNPARLPIPPLRRCFTQFIHLSGNHKG